MERVARYARYFRWMWRADEDEDDDAAAAPTPASLPTSVADVSPRSSSSSAFYVSAIPANPPLRRRSHEAAENGDDTREFWGFLESILLCEDIFCSFLAFLVYNVLFWSVMLKFGCFATITTTAMLMMFWCWAVMEPVARQDSEAREAQRAVFYCRIEKLKQIGRKILHNLEWLRNEQPGLFCILACTASICVWLLGHVISGVMFIYMMFTCILMGPAILLKVPDGMPHGSQRESDSEIEEFLPAATETNIKVLTQAGEAGEYLQTPTSALAPSITNEEQEFLNDRDLAGHKMPSHEDGSSDGLELSDLELSDKNSTSSSSNISDGEFEIIEHQEIEKLNTQRDSTL